jgi:hypothetical protein
MRIFAVPDAIVTLNSGHVDMLLDALAGHAMSRSNWSRINEDGLSNPSAVASALTGSL